MFRTPRITLIPVALAVLMAGSGLDAQRLSYTSGENVSPGYEGWEEDADGSRWFVFGYMNRNWEDEPVVPVGPDNSIEPGGPDLGQPTRFQPRRNRFVFRVPIPEDFEADDEMIWTLTVNGVTERAYATLRPDYFMDNMIRASEHGAIGAGFTDDKIRGNQSPTLRVEGDKTRTVRVGEPLTLVAVATDDGVPESPRAVIERLFSERLRAQFEGRDAEEADADDADGGQEASAEPATPPRRPDRRWLPHARVTVNAENGLRVSWFVYRGEGDVMFDPPQIKTWEDTRTGAYSPWGPAFRTPDPPEDDRWVTEVTFDQPGTYELLCWASDGALDVDHSVTVTVTP